METDIKVFKHEEEVEVGDLIEFESGEHVGIVVNQGNGYNVLLVNNEFGDVFFGNSVSLEKIQEMHEYVIRKKNEYKIKIEEN